MPTKQQLLTALDGIIEDLKSIEVFPAPLYQMDEAHFYMWRSHALAFVGYAIPKDHPLYGMLMNLQDTDPKAGKKYLIGMFLGVRKAIEHDLLQSMISRLRQDVSADDLSLADAVMTESASKDQSRVAAAVIGGTTLERALRAKCEALGLEITKPNGERKALNALIDALLGSKAITPLRAKQMRAWADIRNSAAHGDFDKFTRADVESFLRDVPAALADLG